MFRRDPDRNIDGIDSEVLERSIMNQRALAVRDRVRDDGIDCSVCVDVVVMVDVSHPIEADLAGSQGPLCVKGGVGEWGAKSTRQQPGRSAHLPHADTDGWRFGCLDKFEHADVVMRSIGHRCNLDDIGVELGHPLVDIFQVFRRFAKIMETDNPLCLSVSRNSRCNILLKIDIVHALGDCHTQNRLTGFFTSAIFSTILLAPAGGNHRSGSLAEEFFKVNIPLYKIEAEFHQLGTLRGKMLMLGDHVSVPTAADGNTNHGCLLLRKDLEKRMESRSRPHFMF